MQNLYNKINAKEIFVQSNTSNLIKQTLFKITSKASKIISKKVSFRVDFIIRKLQNSYKSKIFSNCQNYFLLLQNARCQEVRS